MGMQGERDGGAGEGKGGWRAVLRCRRCYENRVTLYLERREGTYYSSFYSAIVSLDIHRHASLHLVMDIRGIAPLHDGYVDVDCPIMGNDTEVLPVLVFREWSQERCGYSKRGVNDPCALGAPICPDNGNKVTCSRKR
jgi:hypothetical protein